jgi:hypothetical protein
MGVVSGSSEGPVGARMVEAPVTRPAIARFHRCTLIVRRLSVDWPEGKEYG